MDSKKPNIVTKKIKTVSAEEVADLFKRKQMVTTSRWITFSLENTLPTEQDLFDLLDTLKIEVRTYRQEYCQDSDFKESCYQFIWETIIGALTSDVKKFNKLTGELIPIISRIIQTNMVLEDIVKVAEKLEMKPKYYMICFYFLILMEGSFKNVLKNLRAMKGISSGKDVSITETLGVQFEKTIEGENDFKNALPNRLKNGIHNNLRNSIAHGNFQYSDEENKIEFWDLLPRTHQYTLKPTKLTFEEFSRYIVEINLFCEIFGFIILSLLAVEDIRIRRRIK